MDDKESRVILSFSLGTIFFIMMVTMFWAFVLTGLVAYTASSTVKHDVRFPRLWSPQPSANGQPDLNHRGELPRSDVDRYGPVNTDALDEPKQGRILDRIINRRTQCVWQQPTSRFTNPVYVEQRPSCSVVSMPPATAQPGCNCSKPVNPDFTGAPRAAKKTGAFACVKCGQSKVGYEWQTYWLDAGTPITICCRTCWSKMTDQERVSLLNEWLAHQLSGARGAYPSL